MSELNKLHTRKRKLHTHTTFGALPLENFLQWSHINHAHINPVRNQTDCLWNLLALTYSTDGNTILQTEEARVCLRAGFPISRDETDTTKYRKLLKKIIKKTETNENCQKQSETKLFWFVLIFFTFFSLSCFYFVCLFVCLVFFSLIRFRCFSSCQNHIL